MIQYSDENWSGREPNLRHSRYLSFFDGELNFSGQVSGVR
jgi:hypothetical protein